MVFIISSAFSPTLQLDINETIYTCIKLVVLRSSDAKIDIVSDPSEFWRNLERSCQNCHHEVTSQWVRVFGDEGGRVYSCPRCNRSTDEHSEITENDSNHNPFSI